MATLLVSVAAPASAQSAAALVGKWNIEYERGRRMEDGVVTPVMGTGTLTIAMKGDSAEATLQAGPRPDGTPSPAATFRGAIDAAKVVFVQKSTVMLNMNGEQQSREVTVTWTLQANGDALSGSLLRVIADAPMAAEPTPVKGTRAK